MKYSSCNLGCTLSLPSSQEKARWSKLTGDLSQLREEGKRLHGDKAKNFPHLEVATNRMRTLLTDKDCLQKALLDLDLQSAEEEETQEDVATYEIEIQECKERIEALVRERGEREEALRVAKEEVKECDRKILEMEAGVDEATKRMENLRVGSNWNML